MFVWGKLGEIRKSDAKLFKTSREPRKSDPKTRKHEINSAIHIKHLRNRPKKSHPFTREGGMSDWVYNSS